MARPSEALIDLDALGRNFDLARAQAGTREVIAVVKADAYGHGAVACTRALRSRGCRCFAVLSVEEMAGLRDAGAEEPLLVLAGPHNVADARELASRRAVPVVHHRDQVAWLAEAAAAGGGPGAPLEVHVEVDTGMRRMGAAPEDAPGLFEAIARRESLRLGGAMTHFSSADERDLGPSLAQQERFRAVLQGCGGAIPTLHLANSAALLATPAFPLAGDAVRPGLMLYGARPAPHLGAALAPVMQLRTEVIAVRRVGRGEGVGYGAIWRAVEAGYVATIGLGYADGLPTSLANIGEVEVAGRRAPLVGRVSMDSAGVWLGPRPAPIGTPVCVFGSETLRVDEVAKWAGTLSYELMVRVGARVPRRYVGVADGANVSTRV